MKNTNMSSSDYAELKKRASQLKSKMLPIYIVKKDSTNSKVLDRKRVNFQINFGNVYHISYKYFTPKGYHLANDSKSKYTCQYTNEGLNVNSITFTYDKDKDSNQPQPQPVQVNYIDINDNQRIQAGSASGQYGQAVNVLDQLAIPSGYVLCNGQKTTFKINDRVQPVNLMVKKISVANHSQKSNSSNDSKSNASHQASKSAPASNDPAESTDEKNHDIKHINAKVTNNHDQPAQSLQQDIEKNVNNLKQNLREYDCNIAVELIHEVLHRNLAFFKKVITGIFSKMKYRSIDNLNSNPKTHKISGVIKKYLYNNNQVNFTFVRAKKCDISDQITISEVRDFVTSVIDHNSSKGIFITTSHFSSDARKEAERHSIILIDATRLARLMIRYNVGVKPQRIFRIVDLDKAFFN